MPSKSARRSGWKSIQSRKKVKQKTKLAILVLISIILLLIFAQVFRFTKTLFSPWNGQNTQRSYSWNGKFNINLLFRSKGVALVSYNPTDQKIIVVNIPDETYLETAGGFGKWQVRSIFGLGGDKLLKDSMVNFLGQPIDGFLDFSSVFQDKDALEVVELIRSNPTGIVNILPDLKTDLTLFEVLRLNFALRSVRFDKLTQIDLLALGALTHESLLDGTEVLTADPNKLDVDLADLADPKIKQEHKTIALFNATQKALFAQKWARLITNIGGDVIITSNAQSNFDKTIVVGEKSDTLERLAQIFNSYCKDANCDKIQNDEDLSSSRAQINIKLAPDLIN